jgi:hypothetical protein
MKNKILLKTKLIWKKHPENNRFFYIEDRANTIILLRINNFPEEPLYTIINGSDIIDLDDIPSYWILDT